MGSRALIALGQELSVASGASRGETLTVFMLVLVALALRAYHIDTESLWLDETASVWIASRPLGTVLGGELTNPPLYYLLLHFWIGIFGTAEAAIRWLSVWPSVAAIVVSYVLARRLYGHRTAIVAAGLMAISPYQIYYAQEARAFALLLFLSLCSTLFFHIALTRPSGYSSFGPWLAYGVTTIAALHTHFHAVFMLAAQYAIFVLLWRGHRGRLRGWLAVQAIVVIAFMPWLLTMHSWRPDQTLSAVEASRGDRQLSGGRHAHPVRRNRGP
jgi:uncharacterized membrane protein